MGRARTTKTAHVPTDPAPDKPSTAYIVLYMGSRTFVVVSKLDMMFGIITCN
jgi:hypothetical protein